MADPLWLDANIVADVANSLEAELKARHKAGQTLLTVPKAHEEVMYGNPMNMDPKKPIHKQQPSPQTRTKIQLIMGRLSITVDREGAKLSTSAKLSQAERVG